MTVNLSTVSPLVNVTYSYPQSYGTLNWAMSSPLTKEVFTSHTVTFQTLKAISEINIDAISLS